MAKRANKTRPKAQVQSSKITTKDDIVPWARKARCFETKDVSEAFAVSVTKARAHVAIMRIMGVVVPDGTGWKFIG